MNIKSAKELVAEATAEVETLSADAAVKLMATRMWYSSMSGKPMNGARPAFSRIQCMPHADFWNSMPTPTAEPM